MKKSVRDVRRVSGKDPELSFEAYEEWKETVRGNVRTSVPCKMMEVICKNTIESVRMKRQPFTWMEAVHASGVNRSHSYTFTDSLEKAGFIEIVSRDPVKGRRIIASKKAIELYLEGVEKLYTVLGESL